MGLGLYDGFMNGVFPMALELGKLLFTLGLISGCYVLIRGIPADSIRKIKYATIGYTLMKCIVIYIELIDKIVANIHF